MNIIFKAIDFTNENTRASSLRLLISKFDHNFNTDKLNKYSEYNPLINSSYPTTYALWSDYNEATKLWGIFINYGNSTEEILIKLELLVSDIIEGEYLNNSAERFPKEVKKQKEELICLNADSCKLIKK